MLRIIFVGIFIIALVKLFLYSQNTFIKALESEKEMLERQVEFSRKVQQICEDFEKVLNNVYKYAGLRTKEYELWQENLTMQQNKALELQKEVSEIKEASLRLKDEFSLKQKKLEDEIAALQEEIEAKDKQYKSLHLKYIDLLNKFNSPLILKKHIRELREKKR